MKAAILSPSASKAALTSSISPKRISLPAGDTGPTFGINGPYTGEGRQDLAPKFKTFIRLTMTFLVLTPHRYCTQRHAVVTATGRQYPGLSFRNLLSQITPFPGDLDSSICGLCTACQRHELVIAEHVVESFSQLPIVWIVKWLSCIWSAGVDRISASRGWVEHHCWRWWDGLGFGCVY